MLISEQFIDRLRHSIVIDSMYSNKMYSDVAIVLECTVFSNQFLE